MSNRKDCKCPIHVKEDVRAIKLAALAVLAFWLLFFAIYTQADQLFENNCASCHGTTGKGDGPIGQYLTPKPRNLTADKFKNGDSAEQIENTLKTGLDQMPSFPQLSEADRKALALYVKGLRK